MLFTSEVFLFLFLPFTVAVYFLAFRKNTFGKNVFLLFMLGSGENHQKVSVGNSQF